MAAGVSAGILLRSPATTGRTGTLRILARWVQLNPGPSPRMEDFLTPRRYGQYIDQDPVLLDESDRAQAGGVSCYCAGCHD